MAKPQHVRFTQKGFRQQMARLDDEQILSVARGAIDELTARSVLKCSVAIKIIELLAPENVRVRAR